MNRRDDEEEFDDIDVVEGVHRVDDVWTPKMVGAALVASLRIANRVAGPTHPKEFGNAMPRVVYEAQDIDAWEGDPDDDRQIYRTASAAAIARMERALTWQTLYLGGASRQAEVLKLWLRCRVRRRPFGAECKRKGWARSQAYVDRDRALGLIAQGLTRDGVPPWQ